MYFPPIISRAELADTTSGREGALLIGTDTKTNLGSAASVEAALTHLNTFLGSAVTSTEFGYLDGVTSAIQTQLDAKATAFAAQVANVVYAGPATGVDATPTFRALVIADLPTGISALNIADGSVTNAEFQYLGGVTSDIQTQLNAKSASSHNHAAADITSGTVATARLGSGTADNTVFLRGDQTWAGVTPTAPTVYTETDGATVTFNLSNSVSQLVVLGGNRTLAVSNDAGNVVFDIQLKQDGTGSRTVTWFSGITWAGGVAPTLTTAINKTDWFGFRRTGSGTYHGVVIAADL